MKNYLFIFLLLSTSLFSQDIDILKELALKDAKVLSNASVTHHISDVLKYTHPKITKQYGQAQLKSDIEKVFKTMSEQKIKIVSSEINELTEIKKEKKEYHCLIKNTIKIDFNGQFMTLKSSLFGFYDKKINQWYFIESNKLINDPDTKAIFKGFSTEITIPADEQIAHN